MTAGIPGGEPRARRRPSGRFGRAVGLVIVGLAGTGAAVLAFVAASGRSFAPEAAREGLVLGLWSVLYDAEAPPVRVLLMAASLAVIFAAGVALMERRVTDSARRSFDRGSNPLAPKVVMAATRGVFAGPVTITVLIPAHNEAACIGATIASLKSQSERPRRIVVVADNCTDATKDIALSAGVECFETTGNMKKKAGALNQALDVVLPGQGDNDLVMVMDADTVLDAGFLAAASRRMTGDRALMAVGGLFYGEQGSGVLGQFQRNEYIRYARAIRRRRGRVFVLTGTASIFRPAALRTIAASRGVSIPGTPGDVYDTAALTEDNELTIALKSLGGLMVSPSECTVVTEVMPTWRALVNQRLRWQRGALENLAAYGVTPQTLRYWAQQLGIGYGVIALSAYLLLVALTVLSLEQWVWFPFWLGLGALFVLERVITVWHGGWPARLLALTLFPELLFALVLNGVYLKGVLDIGRGRQADWAHVARPASEVAGGLGAPVRLA